MGTLTVGSKTVEDDEEGYLVNRLDWDEEIAKVMAKTDNCDLRGSSKRSHGGNAGAATPPSTASPSLRPTDTPCCARSTSTPMRRASPS